MKIKILPALAAAAVLLLPAASHAQAVTNTIQTELRALIQKVQLKIKAEKKTEADFAGELKDFDRLIAKENGAKTDEAAQIAFMKAMLYLEVLDNTNRGAEIIRQVKADYPETKYGKGADRTLENIATQAEARTRQAEAQKKQDTMFATGANFPDFAQSDLTGKPISVGALKGKVVG